MKCKENRAENSTKIVQQLPKLKEKRLITKSYCSKSICSLSENIPKVNSESSITPQSNNSNRCDSLLDDLNMKLRLSYPHISLSWPN